MPGGEPRQPETFTRQPWNQVQHQEVNSGNHQPSPSNLETMFRVSGSESRSPWNQVQDNRNLIQAINNLHETRIEPSLGNPSPRNQVQRTSDHIQATRNLCQGTKESPESQEMNPAYQKPSGNYGTKACSKNIEVNPGKEEPSPGNH